MDKIEASVPNVELDPLTKSPAKPQDIQSQEQEKQNPTDDDPAAVREFFNKEKLSYGDVLKAYMEDNPPQDIELSKIKFGSFRRRTENGLRIIRKSIEDTKGKVSDGLIQNQHLIIQRLHNNPEGFEYKCLDGNHRLTVFKEMHIRFWPCVVIDANLTAQEKFILSHGNFSLFIMCADWCTDLLLIFYIN